MGPVVSVPSVIMVLVLNELKNNVLFVVAVIGRMDVIIVEKDDDG